MSLILYIETATATCSVALADGNKLLALKERTEANIHAGAITLFIQNALQEVKKTPNDLDAVCVSMGPGSYTGLRIGVSTAKGLCYGLDIPLLAMDTLKSMAYGMADQLKQGVNENILLCPMLDARRMEVYAALYDTKINVVQATSAIIVDENTYLPLLESHKIVFFGTGADKCVSLYSHHPNALFPKFNISAKHMLEKGLEKLTEEEFEDIAYFEPFYLKDFMVKK